MRHTGIPLPEPLINNDLLICFVAGLGIAMLVLLKQPRSLVFTSLAGIISNDAFYAKNATIGDHIKHYILLALSIIGISLYATKSFLPTQFSTIQISTIGIGISGYLLAKLLLMNGYFRLFFGAKSRELIYQYISLIITLGFVCFAGYVLLQFSPSIPSIVIHAIIGLTSIVCALLIIYILFKDFFNKVFLFFHFILYLCTFEILPVLVVLKCVV